MFEQEFLYAGTQDELEKLFRVTKGFVPTGPHHGLAELDRRRHSGRGFINDAHFPTVDRIDAVDDAHFGLPCANEIHHMITMLRVEKVGTVFILGFELSERTVRDLS